MKQASFSTAIDGRTAGAEMPGWSVKNLLAHGARDWKLSSGMTVFISLIIPALIMLTGVVTALLGKEAYKWFTEEDGVAEDLQVLFWVLALALGIRVMLHLWKTGPKVFALLYLGLNLFFVFVIGEEISWGQRIFGWQTSAEMSAINKQHETNIHNINGVGDKIKWIHVMIGAYGTILPLVGMRLRNNARYSEAILRLVPHYTLVPHFFATLVWRLQANLWNPPKSLYFVITEYSEVMELVLAVVFFLFVLFQFKNLKRSPEASPVEEMLPLNSTERINRLLQQRSY